MSWTKKLASAIASNAFFNFVIGLSVVQGIWYAVSFRPQIFDEPVHLGFIRAYSHQLSPFITHQTTRLDVLGETTRNASYLYYYLMSWPLRFISLFIHSQFGQVILLRLINIMLFAAGLIVFKKLFDKMLLPKAVTNLGLLFLILTPVVAILPGAVNYDNAVFLLSAVLALIATDLITNLPKSLKADKLVVFVILGLLGSLVKFEFLALFVPATLYIGILIWSQNRHRLAKDFKKSFQSLSKIYKLLLVSLLIVAVALFIERPVTNLVRYHKVSPDCVKLLSQSRCSKNYTAKRNIEALASRPLNFSPQNPFNYLLQQWVPGMITTQTIIPPSQLSSPLLRLLYFSFGLAGLGVLLIYLRELLQKPQIKFLLFVMTAYTLILFTFNYLDYVHFGQPVAITGRYLMPVMPIFIVLVGLCLRQMLNSVRWLALVVLFGALVIFTQGGGITTYLLSCSSHDYYTNSAVNHMNSVLKNHLPVLIKLKDTP